MKDFVFDMDGTLYDSTGVEIAAYQAAFREAGYPVPGEKEILENVGPPNHVMIGNLAGDHRAETIERLRPVVVRHELEAIRLYAKTYPGIDGTVRSLKEKGARLYVCSNAGYEYVHALCEKFGLDELCTRIVSSVPGVTKGEALRRLKREMAMERFAMIGDREYDIAAGREAGAWCVGCAYGFADPGCVSGADRICRSVAELRAHLTALLQQTEKE